MGTRLYDFIKDYFIFNRKEQRGLYVLILILTGLIIADIVISDVLPQKQMDFSEFEKEVKEFEKEMRLRDSIDKTGKENKSGKGYFFSSALRHDSSDTRLNEKKELMVELNAADTFDLQQLRGIGPSFANRIVRYRDRLGGYFEKSQLLEVFGMDAERYRMICDHVKADTSFVKKIDLNTVTFKELLRHPYFPFEITRSIMIYRKEHGKINHVEELEDIKFMNDSLFRKIKPYVRTY